MKITINNRSIEAREGERLHRRRAAPWHRDSALLLSPASARRGQLPHVPREGGERAEADAGVQHACRRQDEGAYGGARGVARAPGGHAVHDAQSSGRLRHLRQGRRVPPAGLPIRIRRCRARARSNRSAASASCMRSARASSSTTNAASSAAAACVSRARCRSPTCSASSSAADMPMVDRVGARRAWTDPYSDNVIGLCPTGALLSTRLSLPEPRVVPRTGALGVHGLRPRLQRQPVAPQERMAAARARRGTQPRGLPRHRLRQPGNQRALDLQQGIRSPQVDGARTRAMRGSAACRRRWTRRSIGRANSAGRRPKRPAMLVSAHASNEELDAFAAAAQKRLAARGSRSICARTARRARMRSSKTTCSSRPTRTRTPSGCAKRFGARAPRCGRRGPATTLSDLGRVGELREPRRCRRDPSERRSRRPSARNADVVIPISTHLRAQRQLSAISRASTTGSNRCSTSRRKRSTPPTVFARLAA